MFNIKKLVVLLLCAGLVFQAHFGIAGPQGGKVVGGNANISQSGPNTTINQTSDRAIINWNSFDIGKNESVRHNMPSSNSAGLHRVVGKGGPSNIEGLLQSNGNIYLVNPAGVVIHNGAKIDVNGFVATSRDIANENFMKGKMVFDKPGLPGAAIINQGNISLRDNGLAALVAPTVRNDGIIAGKLGKVALGGSDAAWKLDMTGDDLIAFTMDEKQVNTLYAADGTPLASVQNNGKIKAEGGVVVLTASQLDGIVGSVVNNGEISAASAETKGGKIIFRGQGNKVDVVNNGHLDVSSKAAEGGNVRMTGQSAVTHAGKIDATGKTKGGNVVITGENVTLKSGSRIDASGTNGGGTVLVGGNARGKGPEVNAKTTLVQSDAEILANAKLYGDGGQIVVWADEKTQFDGKAAARGGENGGDGGLVETSAKLLIIGDPAVVNTSATNGKAGTWLLDPEDFVIAAAGGTMTGQQISDSLENNNVNIEVGDDGDGNGDIIIKDKIQWASDTNLSLSSYGDIIIVSDIIINGNSASLSIEPMNGNFIVSDSKVTFNGNNAELYIDYNKYIIIRSLSDLQNIEDTKGVSYALGNDIDASETEYLDNGKGFKPIYFRGNFEGLGHSISNLYIDRKNDEYIGLFSRISGDSNKIIANLALLNINIQGYGKVGALAGYINGNGKTKIYNVFSNGIVQGRSGIGGLIGEADGIHIERSSSLSDVYTKFDDIHRGFGGGLIGSIDDGQFGSKVIKCYSAGNVEGKYVGGLIGFSCTPLIQDSYSLSNIIGHGEGGQGWVGGFIGQGEGQISNCYSVGKISVNYTEGRFRYIGGFIGSIAYPQTIQNCYWNIETSGQTKGMGMEAIGEGQPPESCIKGLTTTQMMQQDSFNNWNFEKVWKIDEGKSYPELRGVANNDIIFPDNPVNPAPDPKPDPNPEEPDNPDPKPDTPDNPDKPVNPDPKPDTPITPEQPSNPGTNPGDTPSQPSTKPDTKPDNPGTNQPEKPDTPVVPEQPSKPVQPENPVTPEQPSNPGTIPGGNTPSQPDTKPETPVKPNQPSNSGNNSGGSNNAGSGTTQFPTGTTITYKVIDGTVHVFQDNKHLGILGDDVIKIENSYIPVEIEYGKTYITGGDLQVTENQGTNTQETISTSQTPSSPSQEMHGTQVSYNEFKTDMNKYIKGVLNYIGEQFYNDIKQQKKDEEEGISAIKKQILVTPNVLSGNGKETDTLPDEVYEAFAEFVYNATKSSEIGSYENDINKYLIQLCQSISGSAKKINKKITVGGITYTISGDNLGYDGNGLAFATVNWTEPHTNRPISMTLSFASSTQSAAKALADYEIALKNMASEQVKEAVAYFIDDLTLLSHETSKKYVNIGEKIFNAMIDPEKGKELGKEIGEYFYNKYGGKKFFGTIGNNFTDFITQNTTVGKNIEKVVNGLKTLKSEYEKIVEIYNSGKALSEDNGNILQAVSTINDFYNYGTTQTKRITSFLKKQEKKEDKSAILNDFEYYDRPTGDEIRANPTSAKVENFRIVSEGKF